MRERYDGIARDAEDVVEQPDLRRLEAAVAREPALEKDSLRHALARDELHVALEDRVVQRLAVFSSHEIRAERLEHVLERKGARPLADRVGDGDLTGERIAHEHVVGVGPMIHQVDEDRVARQRLERRGILLLDRHLIEEIQHPLGDAIPDLVVGDDVEEGNDLFDVDADPLPCVGLADASPSRHDRARRSRSRNRRAAGAHRLAARQLESVDARAKAQQRAPSRAAGVPCANRDDRRHRRQPLEQVDDLRRRRAR